MENPYLDGGVTRGIEVVQNTVDLLVSEPSALRNLILTASFDYHSYTHSVNVCVYSVALATRLGVGVERVLRDFGNGVLLRDVGLCQIA